MHHGKSRSVIRSLREEALLEAREEPDFDIRIFNTVYPPCPNSDEDVSYLTNKLHKKHGNFCIIRTLTFICSLH